MNKHLVVVACHPDDEILSAGALLIKAKLIEVFKINLLWMTRGAKSTSSSSSRRMEEAEQVAKFLRADYDCLDLEDGKLKKLDLIPVVEEGLKKLDPHIVIWPCGSGDEQHQDHIELNGALKNIAKRWSYTGCSWLTGQPPVFSVSDKTFIPTVFLSYSNAIMEEFKQLIAIYESEKNKDFMRLDRIEARSKVWAADAQVETLYAEPYMLFKGFPPKELFEPYYIESTIEVKEFFDSLNRSTKQTTLALIQSIQWEGLNIPEPYLFSIKGSKELYKLVVRDEEGGYIQVLCSATGNDRFSLLHAFKSKEENTSEDDIRLALDRKHKIK